MKSQLVTYNGRYHVDIKYQKYLKSFSSLCKHQHHIRAEKHHSVDLLSGPKGDYLETWGILTPHPPGLNFAKVTSLRPALLASYLRHPPGH